MMICQTTTAAPDIVKATVTKSRPGQKVGLGLEEHGANDKNNFRVCITEIGGLFKKSGVPVQTGDELLEVNGIPVTDKEHFPNGAKDIRRFLRGEWNIRVKVSRGSNHHERSSSGSLTCSMNSDSDGGVPEAETTAQHCRVAAEERDNNNNNGEAHALVDREPWNSPVPKTQRRKKRKKKDSKKTTAAALPAALPLGSSSHHHNNPETTTHSSQTYIKGVACTPDGGAVTVEMNDGNRVSVDANDLLALVSEQKGKMMANQDNERSKKDIFLASSPKRQGSRRSLALPSPRRPGSKRTLTNLTSPKGSSSRRGLFSLSSPKRPGSKRKVVPASPKKSPATLRSKKDLSTSSRRLLLLETDDDEESTKPRIQPRSKRCLSASTKRLAIPEGDDDDNNDEEKPSKDLPTLQDLRNLMKNVGMDQENTNTPHLPELRDLLKNAPDNTSVEDLVKESWVRTSMTSLMEEQKIAPPMGPPKHPNASIRNLLKTQKSSGANKSLHDLLGERFQKTNPKKWEESSMVSSTMGCMTNLIDPGDLMKIRGFTDRPKMNGATVEVIRRSMGSCGGTRWDVRVIQLKQQQPPSSGGKPDPPSHPIHNPNRLISIAAENLKHFV